MANPTILPANGASTAITNLDATPPVRATSGQGGSGRQNRIIGTATAPINMPTTNFLALVRIPTNAVVSKLWLTLDAAPSTSLTGCLGLVFSPANDGTSAGNQSTYGLTGSVLSVVSYQFFMPVQAITTFYPFVVGGSGIGPVDVTFQNYAGTNILDGFYVPSSSTLPLWQALTTGPGKATATSTISSNAIGSTSNAGNSWTTCTSDPGGYFDIVYFETTTGVNTSAVKMTLSCDYSEAGANL